MTLEETDLWQEHEASWLPESPRKTSFIKPEKGKIGEPKLDANSDASPAENGRFDLKNDEETKLVLTCWDDDSIPTEEECQAMPELVERSDGEKLFFKGSAVSIIAPGGTGKSMVALVLVMAVLEAGGKALYLDFERTKPRQYERLRAFNGAESVGALNTEQLKIVEAHKDPLLASRKISKKVEEGFARAVSRGSDLVIIDSMNDAMTKNGLNPMDMIDCGTMFGELVAPFKNAGALVVIIDHVTKAAAGEGSSPSAIGSVQKFNGSDAVLDASAIQTPGRGKKGLVRLTLRKDNYGALEALAGRGEPVVDVRIDSDGKRIDWEIMAPDRARQNVKGGSDQDAEARAFVKAHLEMVGPWVSNLTDISKVRTPGLSENSIARAVLNLKSSGEVLEAYKKKASTGRSGQLLALPGQTIEQTDGQEEQDTLGEQKGLLF